MSLNPSWMSQAHPKTLAAPSCHTADPYVVVRSFSGIDKRMDGSRPPSMELPSRCGPVRFAKEGRSAKPIPSPFGLAEEASKSLGGARKRGAGFPDAESRPSVTERTFASALGPSLPRCCPWRSDDIPITCTILNLIGRTCNFRAGHRCASRSEPAPAPGVPCGGCRPRSCPGRPA